MELKDYTIEELQDEIKRRQKENRRSYIMSSTPEYSYITAKVIGMSATTFSNCKYHVTVSSESKQQLTPLQIHTIETNYIPLLSGVFKKHNAPKIGDEVIIRARKTKYNPTGWDDLKAIRICEVLED